MAGSGLYHVVLIGCDEYPPGQRSLKGCVNDIDAIEELLLGEPGVGIPSSQIRATRLAAPRAGTTSTSRFIEKTQAPSKANIVAALQQLAGVDPEDRVLIYYSGHGGQLQRRDRQGWYECLYPADERPLYDVEMNALIAAITKRTSDLTVVLDCCHSAGAAKDIDEMGGGLSRGASRVADMPAEASEEPDPAILALGHLDAGRGAHFLQTSEPSYLVIAACQADERAQEDALDGGKDHGFLTYGLLKLLRGFSAEQRARLRWADIWPQLLGEVRLAAATTKRRAQHPWVIGRPERRLFGGSWVEQDCGFQIHEESGGIYQIEAGTLVGVTTDAILGIYDRVPERFPLLNSPEDDRVRLGKAEVTQAERSTCHATLLEPRSLSLPPGARARLIQPGRSERLRIHLDPADPDPTAVLAESPLLAIGGEDDIPEVWVTRTPKGWELSNDMNRALARVRLDLPAGRADIEDAHEMLRDALDAYAHYNLVLRLAKRCCDPELHQSLVVTLLDCRDQHALAQVDPKQPALPELPRNASLMYEVPARTLYCIRLTNTSKWHTLYLTVFDCTAGGMAQFLGTVNIREEDTETLWWRDIHRSPIAALPDDKTVDTVDRLVVIATTRPGIGLRGLETKETIQEMINTREKAAGSLAPVGAELWTAVTVPLKIRV